MVFNLVGTFLLFSKSTWEAEESFEKVEVCLLSKNAFLKKMFMTLSIPFDLMNLIWM